MKIKDKIVQITSFVDGDNSDHWMYGLSEAGNLYWYDFTDNSWEFSSESPKLEE